MLMFVFGLGTILVFFLLQLLLDILNCKTDLQLKDEYFIV